MPLHTHEEILTLIEGDAARSREGYVPEEIRSAHPDGFLATWVVGGVRHNRYGTDVARAVEPEPEVEPLLELLDDLGLRRRQVNEVKALFGRGTHRDVEDHDGSWSEVAYKHLSAEALVTKLVELGVAQPRPASPGTA